MSCWYFLARNWLENWQEIGKKISLGTHSSQILSYCLIWSGPGCHQVLAQSLTVLRLLMGNYAILMASSHGINNVLHFSSNRYLIIRRVGNVFFPSEHTLLFLRNARNETFVLFHCFDTCPHYDIIKGHKTFKFQNFLIISNIKYQISNEDKLMNKFTCFGVIPSLP